jgi:hypothetical protein
MKQWIEDIVGAVSLIAICYMLLMWGYILEGLV